MPLLPAAAARVGTTLSPLLVAAVAAAAVLVRPPSPGQLAVVRLGRIARPRLAAPPEPTRAGPQTSRWLAAGAAGLAVAILVGGATGLLAGAVLAALLHRWLAGLEPASVRNRRLRLAADLPGCADLMAACLLAGSPAADAVEIVAEAIGGPLADELRTVVATLRLGGDPASSWLALARDPALAPLARAWARALDTGAPLAQAMARLADEQREIRRWRAEADARRAGITATAPLGACFLPAFILIGIVPAVAGIATGLLR